MMATTRAAAIAAIQRTVFEALVELDKTSPHDVDAIVSMMVSHLRSWRPVAVAALGTLSAAAERVSAARWGVILALTEARRTSGAGWRDASVKAARAEFVRAAAHAAARQVLQDVLAEELSS